MTDEYTDAHRVFAQKMIQHRVLSIEKAKEVFQYLRDKYEIDSNLSDFVNLINEELENLHFAIRKIIQEEKNGDVECYVLVNLLNNKSVDISGFNRSELLCVKHLIDALIQLGDGALGENAVLMARPPHTSLTNMQEIVNRLVEQNWLTRDGGILSISALMLGEFQAYMNEHYQDICTKCSLCKAFTFKGYQCPQCNRTNHKHCLNMIWSNKKRTMVCPNNECKTRWKLKQGIIVEDDDPKKSKSADS